MKQTNYPAQTGLSYESPEVEFLLRQMPQCSLLETFSLGGDVQDYVNDGFSLEDELLNP